MCGLAFAVAAHLESEILIVDEVLAVGDAEFQKKCLGKMGDVSKGEGRTVLFVSHNMGSILNLCKKGLLLDKGKLVASGAVNETITQYNHLLNTGEVVGGSFDGTLKRIITFNKIAINGHAYSNILTMAQKIEVDVSGYADRSFQKIVFIISVYLNGVRIFTLREFGHGRTLGKGNFKVRFVISCQFFAARKLYSCIRSLGR